MYIALKMQESILNTQCSGCRGMMEYLKCVCVCARAGVHCISQNPFICSAALLIQFALVHLCARVCVCVHVHVRHHYLLQSWQRAAV